MRPDSVLFRNFTNRGRGRGEFSFPVDRLPGSAFEESSVRWRWTEAGQRDPDHGHGKHHQQRENDAAYLENSPAAGWLRRERMEIFSEHCISGTLGLDRLVSWCNREWIDLTTVDVGFRFTE